MIWDVAVCMRGLIVLCIYDMARKKCHTQDFSLAFSLQKFFFARGNRWVGKEDVRMKGIFVSVQ